MEQRLKKNRAINWSGQEKKVLKMLIAERADVIERKETSTKINTAKKIAWREVLLRFNAINSLKRDLSQLQNQWRNMKNRAKKKTVLAQRRANAIMNGPPPTSPSEDNQIQGIPYEIMVESNCYDRDSNYDNHSESSEKKQDNPEIEIRARSMTGGHPPGSTYECREIRAMPVQVKFESNCFDNDSNYDNRSESSEKKQDRPGNKTSNSQCCAEDHEHEIFILAKTAREESMRLEKEAHECKMRYEREVHERRITIMALEEEYWKTKIKELNKLS